MKKVLFVATVVKTHIMEFHIPYLKMFKEKGWETAVAAKNDYEDQYKCKIPYCDKYYNIPFERSPLSIGNLYAYRMLKKIVDMETYNIIHCHTPVGAMIARLAGRKARKKGTRIIYTAHGFHFYKNAPFFNWLVFFPVEWLCSFLTDTLITINEEDYLFAKKHMHAKQVKYVPGVGIDLEKSDKEMVDAPKKRLEMGVPEGKIWVLCVGELTPNKNHENLIKAIADIPQIYLTIAGSGELCSQLLEKINDLGLENRVKLLGYRQDVLALCKAADVFAFPSFREGLSLALMEAMACKKPIVCSKIRGNTDLIHAEGGELFDPFSVDEIKIALNKAIKRDWNEMGKNNAERIKKYSLENVKKEMEEIYNFEENC